MRIHQLSQLGTRLKNVFQSGDLVLLYHRIAEPESAPLSDPFSLCVTPDRFEAHLECLGRLADRKSLSELVSKRPSSSMGRASIAVTFDDGYRDNFQEALPRLIHYKTPATVFVVSGALGSSFWWDRLAALIESCDRLPTAVDLQVEEHQVRWRPSASLHKSRRQLLRVLHRALRHRTLSVIDRTLEHLAEILGVPAIPERLPATLSTSELRELANSRIMNIGSHTATHRPMAALSQYQQREELLESKKSLETATGNAVECFSYPYGTRADIGKESAMLVRQAGYRFACTNVFGPVTGSTDAILIPRFWVSNWPKEEFERRISRYLSH